jgi:hypothetical protein
MTPISGSSPDSGDAVKVARIAQDQQKAEGQQMVQMIRDAAPPPPGLQGQGSMVNLYA